MICRLSDLRYIKVNPGFLEMTGHARDQVIVAGQPLELNDEACMLFSFVDIEPRHKAEVALRQSEERFAKAFRLTDKEIAARLKLAPNTVRNHVSTVYSKLDFHSRSEAIDWARERGLFSSEWLYKAQR